VFYLVFNFFLNYFTKFRKVMLDFRITSFLETVRPRWSNVIVQLAWSRDKTYKELNNIWLTKLLKFRQNKRHSIKKISIRVLIFRKKLTFKDVIELITHLYLPLNVLITTISYDHFCVSFSREELHFNTVKARFNQTFKVINKDWLNNWHSISKFQ
jgi:hypothetical protein